MRHEPVLLLTGLTLLANLERCEAIVCYYCTSHTTRDHKNLTAKLCSAFDYSNYYHTDCPYSTFCLKTSYEMTLQEGKKVRVSERGCAPQKWVEQEYREGTWYTLNKIDRDVYNAGCQTVKGLGLRSAETEYCYCTRNLCNTANPILHGSLLATLLPLIAGFALDLR